MPDALVAGNGRRFANEGVIMNTRPLGIGDGGYFAKLVDVARREPWCAGASAAFAMPPRVAYPAPLDYRRKDSRRRKNMAGSVRPARPRDAAAVGDLVRASYSSYVERMGKEPAPMLCDYAALIGAGEVWVLAEGEEVIGVLVMRPAEDHLFVDNVAVAPEHQRRGLGRRLMTFAEEKAAERGLPEVRLYTNEKMFENLAVYRRLGFEETVRRLDGGYRRVFMRKLLPPGG